MHRFSSIFIEKNINQKNEEYYKHIKNFIFFLNSLHNFKIFINYFIIGK